jgi:hypothetical protein
MEKQSSTISEKVRARISQEKIKPIPRWHFVLKHGFSWVLLLILVLLGGLMTGLAIYEIGNIEWDLQPLLGIGAVKMLFLVFPYFWLGLLIVVLVLAYFNFIHIPQGYRYPRYQVVVFGLLVILLTGLGLYYLGWAGRVRENLPTTAPWIQLLLPNKAKLLNLPDKGILVGRLQSMEGNEAVVRGVDGSDWRVDLQLLALPSNKQISDGQNIILVGRKTGDHQFKARVVRPLQRGAILKLRDLIKNKLSQIKN